MKILVLPISGGGFPFQLAVIRDLATIEWKPDISLATSGGNVAAYTAAAGDWKVDGIDKACLKLSSNVFTKSWLPSTIPSHIVGLFQGSIYKSAKKESIDFFEKNFTKETVSKYEVWSGTTHIYERSAQMICNRSKSGSVLGGRDISCSDTGCREAMYMNGDVCNIGLASLASASIPAIVPHVEVEGEILCDGGMLYASPLSCLSSAIHAAAKEKKETIHITYISSRDTDTPPPDKNTLSGTYFILDDECSKYPVSPSSRTADQRSVKQRKNEKKRHKKSLQTRGQRILVSAEKEKSSSFEYPLSTEKTEKEIMCLSDHIGEAYCVDPLESSIKKVDSNSTIMYCDSNGCSPRPMFIEGDKAPPQKKSIAGSGMMIASIFTTGNCRRDRLAGIDLLKAHCPGTIHYICCYCNSGILKDIEGQRQKAKGTMVEYYPLWEVGVCMTSFVGSDVVKSIKKVSKGYMARIWWSGDEDLFSSLKFEKTS